MGLLKRASLAPALLVLAASAGAAEDTATFTVSLEVVPVCLILTVTDVVFTPTIERLNRTLNATGVITVRCTNGTPYTLELDGGGQRHDG